MKKFMSMLLVIAMLFGLFGCGTDKVINGVEYETKGLFTLDEKDPNIQYKVIVGNVIWGILLIESVVFPIYFFGFSMYEAVGPKDANKVMKF